MTYRTIELFSHCLGTDRSNAASDQRRRLAMWAAASGARIGPTPIHSPEARSGDESDGIHGAQPASVMVDADQQSALHT